MGILQDRKRAIKGKALLKTRPIKEKATNEGQAQGRVFSGCSVRGGGSMVWGGGEGGDESFALMAETV